jgi:hypothetical protein
MRSIPPALALAQRQSSVRPAIMITVGDVAFKTTGTGSTVTCHNTSANEITWTKDEGGRILKVKALESPYKQTAEITLNNYDRLLFDLSLKGQRLNIAWGATTQEGDLYSTSPVMWVKQQTFYEAQGVMQCLLKCIGIMDLLNSDTASEKYIDDGTTALGDLVTAILTSTLDCFDHCKVYNVVVDDDLDDLWTGVYLGETFVIDKNETRAHVLARLFDMTHASMRPGGERPDEDDHDTIHIFTPSQTVQSEYTLERANHRFYVDSDSSGIVMPNEIIIKTPSGYDPAYEGRAIDAISHNTNPCSRTQLVVGLVSSNQAQTIANTMLSNIILAESGSSAFVPMNCGTEIFDRMKVTSKRSDRILEGSVGSITRLFDPMAKEPRYDMSVGFGKWFDPRAMDDSLGYGYGFVDDVTPSSNSFDSGHISLFANTYFTKSGAEALAFAMSFNDDAQYATYKFQSGAGSYGIMVSGFGEGTSCITNILVDDVVIDTVNFSSFFASKTTTVLSEGIHTLKILINDPTSESISFMAYFISISKSAFVA